MWQENVLVHAHLWHGGTPGLKSNIQVKRWHKMYENSELD